MDGNFGRINLLSTGVNTAESDWSWRTTAAYTTTAPSAIARPVSSLVLAHVTAVWGAAVLMNAEGLAEVVKKWDYEESYIEEDVVYVWRNCRGCGWRVADGG